MNTNTFLYRGVWALLIALLWAPATYAQTTKTVTDTRDFNIIIKGDAQREVNITLEATYTTDGNKYKLKFKNNKEDSSKTSEKEFNTPLNYQHFLMAFNEMYYAFRDASITVIKQNEQKPLGDISEKKITSQTEGAKKSTDNDVVSRQSTEAVYMWLYTMRDKLDESTPVAGKLHVRRYVKVINSESKIPMSIRAIEDTIDSMEETMYQANASVRKAVAKVSGTIDLFVYERQKQCEREIEEINDSTPHAKAQDMIKKYQQKAAKDVAVLQNLKNTFLRSDYYFGEMEYAATLNAIMHTDEGKDTVQNNKNAKTKCDTLLQRIISYQKALDKREQELDTFKNRGLFPIRNISIKIEHGFIEDIHVEVDKKTGGTCYFDNVIPIGISSMNNIMSLGNVKLFIRKSKNEKGQSDGRFIYLFNVLDNFDINESPQTRDYAPADTVINNLDPSIDRVIIFNKERRYRLFDSRIYSDLAGIDDKAPNGLLQIEIGKRFNFITRRLQYGGNRADWGLFNYIYLYGALTKIEQKLRRLPLRNELTVQNGSIISPNYVTNLDLRKYENTSLGIDLNLLTHNYKDGKFTLYADLGARYGHTPVTDSLPRLTASGQLRSPDAGEMRFLQAHTVTFSPARLRFEYIYDRSIGFNVSYQYNYTLLFSNNEFKQVMSDRKSDLNDFAREKRAAKSHQVCIEARVLTDVTSGDNLFLRSRFFMQQGDLQTFFPQIQVGYNYNFVFKK